MSPTPSSSETVVEILERMLEWLVGEKASHAAETFPSTISVRYRNNGSNDPSISRPELHWRLIFSKSRRKYNKSGKERVERAG